MIGKEEFEWNIQTFLKKTYHVLNKQLHWDFQLYPSTTGEWPFVWTLIQNIKYWINSAWDYSISQEICTRFLLCCALLWLYIDFPISIRLTSLALWQSNDCPSASKATLMNMDKYFMWIHYERLHNHNKAKHNKTVCTFLGIYCMILSLTTNAPSITMPTSGWLHL